jgi:hypothetical protein
MSNPARLDVSRDFLDGLFINHPQVTENDAEIRANGALHFLPSSPDGKMHTAVASFTLVVGKDEKAFAQGGWRFLFTSKEKFVPAENPEHPFLKQLLIIGTSKIMAVLNPLCLHANLPLIPIDPTRLAAAAAPAPQQQQQQ